MRALFAALVAVWLTTACGAAPEHPAAAPGRAHGKGPLPPDVVERAALPLHGVGPGGRELSPRALFDRLAGYDAVCLGESHDNPHHHYAQLVALRALAERAAAAGRELAVGLEMVARPRQLVLDEFSAGKLGDAQLFAELDWKRTWGFDSSLYRPLFDAARAHHLPLLALNAPSSLTRAVARGGLSSLTAEQRAELPELDLSNRQHRRYFEAAMQDHPVKPGTLDRMYAAQVVWDETMAATAASWLEAGLPAPRQIIVIAGSAHCQRAAVPERIERRTGLESAAVLPVVAAGESDEQDAEDAASFDYRIVLDARDPNGSPTG